MPGTKIIFPFVIAFSKDGKSSRGLLPFQVLATTASIRSGVPLQAERRVRDGSFARLLQKVRSV